MLKTIVTAIFAASLVAQIPARSSGAEARLPADPFIASIESMKRSVSPVACLEGSGAETHIAEIHGSAFFISARGEFITAGHVIELLEGAGRPCPIPAIFLPASKWQPEAPEENFVWFPFRLQDCTVKKELDAARCRPIDDLSAPHVGFGFTIDPVKLDFSKQPDGTQVAFTGFPLRSRDPLTSRAGVAAYRTTARKEGIDSELILDHGVWAGGSGSPVYLANGRVVGVILERGIDQGTGIAVARPIDSLADLIAMH